MGNLLILKGVDFSDVAVAKADGVLWYNNYDGTSTRSNAFQMREGALNIIGLNQTSLNGKKVIGVKLLITDVRFEPNQTLYIYKFNGSVQTPIASFSSDDCIDQREISIQCNETLFDDNSWLGIGSMNLPVNAIIPPFCGLYSGGTTKQIKNGVIEDTAYQVYCAIFVKDE